MATDIMHKYLISVVPLVRIPLVRDHVFFYTAKTAVPFGALVHIPIGKRLTKGIAIASKKDFARVGGMTLKPLHDILRPHALTQSQYDLAHFITSHYYTSLGVTLKNFLPTESTPRTKHPSPQGDPLPLATLGTSELACADAVLRILRKQQTCLAQTTFNAFATDWLLHLVMHYRTSSSGTIVIFVPERTLIPVYEYALHRHFPHNDIITLTSTLTKGHFYERSEKIRSRQHLIILATRVGLFAPFHNLSLVITTEAHDMSHKQWAKNPRYDIRTCAPKLAHLHNAHYLAVSASPRIADMDSATRNNHFVALAQNSMPTIQVVDMKIAYYEKNKDKRTKKRPFLSDELILALRKNLDQGAQSLLFINHQGKNAFSTCTRCKTVLRCQTCERALVERTNGSFTCLHCSFTSSIFPHCPSCNNLTFTSVGVGTENIEELLRAQFPKATIARVDSESMKKTSSYLQLYEDFYNGTIDILIGTQMATKGWDVPNLTLAAILDMDQLLGGTDFDTDEKAYSHILQLGSRVGMHGTLIIQAFDTLHSVLIAAQKNLWPTFFEDETAMRQLLHYPPYAQIIKLLYQASSHKECEENAHTLYDELTEICADAAITVSEPHDPLVPKIRSQYRKQLILSLHTDDPAQEIIVPQALHEKLLTLDTKWTIDVDPVTIS